MRVAGIRVCAVYQAHPPRYTETMRNKIDIRSIAYPMYYDGRIGSEGDQSDPEGYSRSCERQSSAILQQHIPLSRQHHRQKRQPPSSIRIRAYAHVICTKCRHMIDILHHSGGSFLDYRQRQPLSPERNSISASDSLVVSASRAFCIHKDTYC